MIVTIAFKQAFTCSKLTTENTRTWCKICSKLRMKTELLHEIVLKF